MIIGVKPSELSSATVEAFRLKLAIIGGVAGSFTSALPTGTIVTDKVYQYAGVDNTTIGGIVWRNGDSALYNGTTWTRIPFQSLANYTLIQDHRAMTSPLFQPTQTYKYIGHAGLVQYGLENTLEAYKASKILGMYGAECDVRMTLDGEIILMHDSTVDRTTNGSGSVASKTLAEIKALDVDTNPTVFGLVKVPTLDEFLIVCKHNSLVPFIEIKSDEPLLDDAIDKILLILSNNGMLSRSVIISFSSSVLDKVRARNSSIWVSYITSPGATISASNITYGKNKGNFIMFAYESSGVLTKEMIDACHIEGIPVIYGMCNSSTTHNIARNLGVDAIMTDKFYDNSKPAIKFSGEFRSLDAGLTWAAYGTINGQVTLTFDTTSASKLAISIAEIPAAWMNLLYPSIEINGYTGENNLVINQYFNSTTNKIELTFIYNGAKVNLGSLPTYVRARISVTF